MIQVNFNVEKTKNNRVALKVKANYCNKQKQRRLIWYEIYDSKQDYSYLGLFLIVYQSFAKIQKELEENSY